MTPAPAVPSAPRLDALLAWYATLVVGKSAERWYAQGKSWGAQGPKQVVRAIVDSLDRDSVLREARDEILARLKGEPQR